MARGVWSSLSPWVIGHWHMRTMEAEVTNGVWRAVDVMDKTSGISYREAAHVIVLGVRYIKVLRIMGGKY